MAKPSQVIVLIEDSCHQRFILRYLRRCGLEQHTMRFVPYPAGEGSGEQFVRERFAVEVDAYRRRRARAETTLIVVIDADDLLVLERLAQLDQKPTKFKPLVSVRMRNKSRGSSRSATSKRGYSV